MASNLSIESPNFDKVNKESGQFTSDAVSLLWQALNDTRATLRRNFDRAQERLEPKALPVSAAASVDDLDTQGASIVEFTGGSAQNFTGMRAPETGANRIMLVIVTGAGTITVKNNVTSESANRIVTNTGADVTRATNTGMILVYLSGKWRQIV